MKKYKTSQQHTISYRFQQQQRHEQYDNTPEREWAPIPNFFQKVPGNLHGPQGERERKNYFPFFFCVCQRVAQDKVDARFPV
jgi:hypothetical protein